MMQSGGMLKPVVGLLAGVAYVILLVRWFHDPGQPSSDGLLLRSRIVWPFVVLFAGLLGAWAYLCRERGAVLVRELRRALALDRTDRAILAVALTLAAVYQLPSFFYPAGVLDSDSVLPGIIAKHIAEGRPPPAFIYTLAYGGTFASHVLALFYTITTPSVVGLVVLTRVYYFLFIAIEFAVLRVSLGRTVATFTVLFLAVPPHFLLTQLTYTELVEILAVGSALSAILAARAAGHLSDNAWYGVAGLLLGIGFWTQPLVMTAGVAGAATVLYFKGVAHMFGRFAPYFLGGVTLGLMPGLVGWGRDALRFTSWFLGADGDGGTPQSALAATMATATVGIRTLFGSYRFAPLGTVMALVVAAAVLGPAAWAVVTALRSAKTDSETADPQTRLRAAVLMVLGLGVIIHLVMFVFSPFNDLVFPPRYLLPLYVGTPALLAWYVFNLMRRTRPWLAHVAVGTVMIGLTAAGLPDSFGWFDDLRDRHDGMRRSHEVLLMWGVRYCEAPYWDAYWLTFYSLEEIICMPLELQRDPYYEAVVMARSKGPYPHLVSSPGLDWLPRTRAGLVQQDIGHLYFQTPLFEVIVLYPAK
ncbi:MAG: hypothetical protein CL477_04470 [Acidobacteria bacterium]|jgi:hypothetical protein|nr:hypothetical protein [Acidobacteriota bacterium]|tara:strand:- start:250 stop:2007 length:1758 start_codon:yes stop_codon:yes gene_type:complete